MTVVPAELLESAGWVALEWQLNGELLLLTRVPKWMQHFFQQNVLNASQSPFLENFLVDARVFWAEEKIGRIRSGIWIETTDGKDHALEASAIHSQERAFLVIEILGGKFIEQTHILQAARESHLESQKLRLEVQDLTSHVQSLERAMLQLASQMSGDQQQKAETLLEQAKQAAHHSQTLQNQYLAQLAHELRTPLAIVLWASELLESSQLDEEQRQQLEQISHAAHHLNAVTSDLLEFYRLEAGIKKPTRALFQLDELARNVMRDMLETARNKQVELHVRAPESLSIAADQRQIRQVLFNLISNAIKFSKPNSNVYIEAIDSGDNLELRIIDEGIGIATADLEKLFKPFGKLENPELNPDGTGLGLVIAQRIVEVHGGTIRVSSAVGLGSTFTVVLPQILN